MNKRRSVLLLILFTFLIMGLIYRLAQIQLIASESFSKHNVNLLEASVSQRTKEFYIDDGRGKILDRNMRTLDHLMKPVVLFFPEFLDQKLEVQKIFSDISRIPIHEIESKWKEQRTPFFIPIDEEIGDRNIQKLKDLNAAGAMVLYSQNDKKDAFMQHALGFVRKEGNIQINSTKEVRERGNKIGISGLQESFDEFLRSEEESKLLYHTDQKGNPLFGASLKVTGDYNSYYPLQLQTTIDLDLQTIAEELVDQHKLVKGGLVLLDIETNSIRAMVSRPIFNPLDPSAKNLEGLKNQVTTRNIPGSVFKVVTLATAYEEQLVHKDDTFNCNLKINNELEVDRPLGKLTLTESLAESCNYTFGALAEHLVEENPNFFEQGAVKLGLGHQVGWRGEVFHNTNFLQLPEEEALQIFADKKDARVPLAVRQSAIGQKDVRVTPLGVANMMATIARGGQSKQVRLVDSIYYKTGSQFFRFPTQDLNESTFSKAAIMQVQNDLRQVVIHPKGTGKMFKDLPYEVAGKSGTGEDVYLKDDRKEIPLNKWFAGYFPYQSPRYALVVVELGTKDKYKSKANAIFFDYVKEIEKFEK